MVSGHLMAATFLKVPELRIDEKEAAMLTKAAIDLAKAFGVPDLTEKQAAIMQAAMAAGTVYGPRVIVIWNRKTSKPKIVPFPITQAVQSSQTPQGSPHAPQGSPAAPPSPPQPQGGPPGDSNGFISSSAFAADAGLETINAS